MHLIALLKLFLFHFSGKFPTKRSTPRSQGSYINISEEKFYVFRKESATLTLQIFYIILRFRVILTWIPQDTSN